MTNGTARSILVLAVLSYVGVLAWFSPLVIQDYPNHLARALIMEDLLFHHGTEFGSTYQYHFLLVPYVLGDLLLATAVNLVGLGAAGTLWVILTFLSLPLSLLVYLRARQTPPDVTVLMLLISLYLSTDTFFIMGFTEFRLSVAIVFVALAVMELLRQRWSWGRYVAFAAIAAASYLTHLAATVFIGAALGASAAWRLIFRKARIDREVLLLAPVIALLGWHFLVAAHYRQPQDLGTTASIWGLASTKVSHLIWDFLRYNTLQELVLLALFAAFLVVCLRGRQLRDRAVYLTPQVFEPWAYAVVFLGLYAVLPFERTEASYIDVRALALVPVFLILGLLNLPPRTAGADSRPGVALQYLAVALVVANLGILAFHLRKSSLWLAQYRAVVAKIPEHSDVLPIYTGGRHRNLYMYLHVDTFAVMDRRAMIPYQFSGDRGSPMKYFRYVRLPYAPEEFWYQSKRDPIVDWKRVRETYRYVLLMKPFAATRIPLQGRVVAENEAAQLLDLE